MSLQAYGWDRRSQAYFLLMDTGKRWLFKPSATDGFRRLLQEQHGLSLKRANKVIESCRRDKRETEWAQVRAS